MKKYPRSLYNLCFVISQSEMENYDVGETLWPCVHYFLDYLKSMITPKVRVILKMLKISSEAKCCNEFFVSESQSEGTQYLPCRSTTLGPSEFLQCIGWESSDAAAKNDQDNVSEGTKPISEDEEALADLKQPVVSQSDAELKVDLGSQDVRSGSTTEKVHPLIQLKSTLEKYVENSDGLDNSSKYEYIEFFLIGSRRCIEAL